MYENVPDKPLEDEESEEAAKKRRLFEISKMKPVAFANPKGAESGGETLPSLDDDFEGGSSAEERASDKKLKADTAKQGAETAAALSNMLVEANLRKKKAIMAGLGQVGEGSQKGYENTSRSTGNLMSLLQRAYNK